MIERKDIINGLVAEITANSPEYAEIMICRLNKLTNHDLSDFFFQSTGNIVVPIMSNKFLCI